MNYDKEPELADTPALPPWWRRPSWGLALFVAALGGIAAGWWWQSRPAAPRAPAPAELRQRQEAAEATARLRGLTAALAAQPAPAEAEKLLVEAVRCQQQLVVLRPHQATAEIAELQRWQVRLDDTRALARNARSLQREQEAGALLQTARRTEAALKLDEALRLQREVNMSAASPSMKNFVRESRLEQDAAQLAAEPLKADLQQKLSEARLAAGERRWRAALALYQTARELQERINRDYSRSSFTDLLLVSRLDSEIAALSAQDLNEEVDRCLADARAAASRQEEANALQLYVRAATAQRQLNERHGQSRFVSMERLEQIEAERQTLEAGTPLREVAELDTAITAHLRRRELFHASQLVRTALARIESVAARQPKARGLDGQLRLKLAYLNLRQNDLGLLQDQLYDQLLPLPGCEQFALTKQEISQAYYARVMNTNPSRNPGRALPVDSLTHAEAEEFCRRLGWILGARVRLPTEAEFRAAVGPDPGANPAWSAANSGGRSQPCGQQPASLLGFHDLLGNLAEWLAADAGEATVAPVMGGSFATPPTELAGVPVRRQARNERSRQTGLRVLVELDLTQLPAVTN